MWELRLILILIGIVFIAAVYLLSRQGKSRRHELHREAPIMTAAGLPDVTPDPVLELGATHPVANSGNADTGEKPRQLIVSLHVASHQQQGFMGAEVLTALKAAGLQYGQYQVFHRMNGIGAQQSIFSVANMVEPGILDPESLPHTRISGLTLFLLLPGPQNSVAACADMLATARVLARQLDGEVLDDKHSVLTSQAAQQLRERILEFQQQLASR